MGKILVFKLLGLSAAAMLLSACATTRQDSSSAADDSLFAQVSDAPAPVLEPVEPSPVSGSISLGVSMGEGRDLRRLDQLAN